jgi:hypothetical protein
MTPRAVPFRNSGSDQAAYCHGGGAMAEGQILAWRRLGHAVLLMENGITACL